MTYIEIFQHLPVIGRFAFVFGLVVILPKLSERAGLPGVFGLLVGGICLGPNLLGLVNPEGQVVQLFSELGKLLLMFFAGFEINLQQVKKKARETLGFGLLTFAVPMVIGTSIGLAFDFNFNASLFIGSLMASHTLLGLPVVEQLGLMKHNAVLMAIGATIITDILAMLILAICVMLHMTGFSTAHLAVILVQLVVYVPLIIFGLSWAAGKVLRKSKTPEMRMAVILLVVCIATLLAQYIELEGIVGAFLAGIAVNRALGKQHKMCDELEIVSKTLFIPIFFLSTGFLVDFKIFSNTLIHHSVLVLLVVGGLLLAKYLAAWLAGLVFKLNRNDTLLMWSLSVPQVAATLAAAIVAYSTINAAGERLLSETMLNAVVVLVVVTSVLGPILTKLFGTWVKHPTS